MPAEQGSKLSERSEFLDPPQATAEARGAEGQVEGGLSFASFSLAVKENEVVLSIKYSAQPLTLTTPKGRGFLSRTKMRVTLLLATRAQDFSKWTNRKEQGF